MATKKPTIADKVINWQKQFGRHHLPWQKIASPYAVWLSEIMLQQTQVQTVVPYFNNFIKAFPTINDLANSPLDEVLKLWTGLGYYARARNLHQAAQQIVSQHNGQLPDDFATLIQLPGIGRSTAGAILSLAYRKAYPILDGNVKRVFCRLFAITDWSGHSSTQKQLWQVADMLLPQHDIHHYNQGLMDLGADVCKRQQPRCDRCPLQADCRALQQNKIASCPLPKPKKERPIRDYQILLIKNQQQEYYLEKRASRGIWGGLWTPPLLAHNVNGHEWCQTQQLQIINQRLETHIVHHFTHFIGHFAVVAIGVKQTNTELMASSDRIWYNLNNAYPGGAPTIIDQLFKQLRST